MSINSLRGMTWDHPRGYDPLAACSAQWKQQTGVDITWDRRSLQDFESYPVEELARRYDLIVIDHPHVGQITQEGCLLPLDIKPREAAFQAISAGTVGASFPSYYWNGRQWAFPIDAATQVQAWVPGRINAPPARWVDMLELAKERRVLCPMRPPHSLMTLYTLAAHLGHAGNVAGPDLFDREGAAQACELMRELMSYLPAECGEMDPIAVLERMAEPGSRVACAPLIYGYVSYSRAGFRPTRIAFSNIPVIGDRAPVGTALGGTGIAVSAYSQASDAAIDFAYWVAGAATQSGLYAEAGGQPGHASAWEDATVNAAVLDFYRATRATLDGAWVRPRHNGYMPFQHTAAIRFNEMLVSSMPAGKVVDGLNSLFRTSLNADTA